MDFTRYHSFKDEHKKLKELILYVSDKCLQHNKFGATKLNKILFFSDFIAYHQRGISITGETYFKLDNGPAPKHLLPVREELRQAKDLEISIRKTFAGDQLRPIALRPPNLSEFDGEEISIVDEVITALRDKSSEEVSEMSHLFPGWILVNTKEDIPYETVYINDPSKILVTDHNNKKAQELAEKNGLI